MASYNIPIKIQVLDLTNETWSDLYSLHANINKSSGKEYVNAATNISSSTYSFKVRYNSSLKQIIFSTEKYRIVYENRVYDIKNVDRYAESNTEITFIGEYNGKSVA